jgi:uncharacterized protein
MNGQAVSNVQGIVTALHTNGFYMQDPQPDSDDSTSEGIFVFTSSAPTVTVGDFVYVNGNVNEFRPGGSGGLTNLTTTELTNPTITVFSHNNPTPTPVILGVGGRVPPNQIIEDDTISDVEINDTLFDQAQDGIDFYESLEGMVVQVNDAVVVGPAHFFSGSNPNTEIDVLGDNGANALERTPRGGVIIQPNTFNPERIIFNDLLVNGPKLPQTANVADTFPGATIGVMDYSFGNFKLMVSSLPNLVSGGLTQEVTTAQTGSELAVSTFNVENLCPTDPQSKFDTLASLLINNLKSPDVVSVEEIQDNNCTVDDGTVDASVTWSMLIQAIQSAGGPTYDYRQIDPVNDQDGGAPGGNIRQGFLFRTDRGLSFVDRPCNCDLSTTPVQVVSGANGPELSFSPGRIDPQNSAWTDSRKPIAGEFMFNGHHLFIIANHFNSKGGDDPLFGHLQPPTFYSEVQRLQQAQVEHDFVQSILSLDNSADIVVDGDINDFQFSNPVHTLEGTSPQILNDLIDTLPENERYSYDYEGNSETLDHILVTNDIFNKVPFTEDVVHVNSEFATQASDHEPQVSRLDPPAAPPTPTATATNTPTPTSTATSTPTPTATTVENEDTAIQYDGWRGITDPNANGGTYRVSKVAGDTAKFTFKGKAITWITLKGSDQGQAQVFIDNVSKGTLDLYSPTVQYNVQFTGSGLSNKSHTVTIKVLGTKNGNSCDTNVVVDGFIVNGVTTQDNTIGVQYNKWVGAQHLPRPAAAASVEMLRRAVTPSCSSWATALTG